MAMIKSRYLASNLVFYETHQWRWLAGWGASIFGFHHNFGVSPIPAADTLNGWTTTLVEGGGAESTITAATTDLGGALLLTTDAAENDGINVQLKGEAWQLTSGRPATFGARLKINDATQTDFFFGLSITATDILGGVTDSIGFRKVDGSTTVTALLEKDSTETTATAHTLVDDTYVTLECYFDGTVAHFLVNGTQLTDPAQTNLPNDELLSPAIHFLTGETTGNTMHIDWMYFWQV